ncbi:MAG: hypothetical protein ACREO7_09720 [Pseudoxanthomonas sp.]
MTDNTTPDPACSLTARAFQERVGWIAALNQEFLRRSQRQGNILTLTYGAAARSQVEDMVSRERDCCAFLEFKITSAGEEVVLSVTVPTHATESADKLLAPFLGDQTSAAATECCGACDVPASPVKAGRIAGTAMATSTTAVVACGACCVLPLAFPAVAATAAGGALVWLGGAHLWMTGLAALTVGAAWLWIWRQSVKRKARAATSTLVLMGLASLALVLAIAWPRIEPSLMAALSS